MNVTEISVAVTAAVAVLGTGFKVISNHGKMLQKIEQLFITVAEQKIETTGNRNRLHLITEMFYDAIMNPAFKRKYQDQFREIDREELESLKKLTENNE